MKNYKGLVQVIIVIILITILVFGYLLLTGKVYLRNNQSEVGKQSPPRSEQASSYGNWKTYSDSKVNLKFDYPAGWTVNAGYLNFMANDKLPKQKINLNDGNTEVVELMINPQQGFCNGYDCKSEAFKTPTGIRGKKYTSKKLEDTYYLFLLGQNYLFVSVNNNLQKEDVERFISSFSLVK